MNTFELVLNNFSTFEKQSRGSNETDLSPRFYSFTSNETRDLINVNSANSQKLNLDTISAETLLELTSSSLTDESLKTSVEYVSVAYGFLLTWSLLDPINGPLKVTNDFLRATTQSLFNDDLTLHSNTEISNLKIAQLFRIAFKKVSMDGLDEGTVSFLRSISGGSTLDSPRIAFEFFYKFWTNKVSSKLTGSKEDIILLNSNIELLNFHLKLLHEKFFDVNKTISFDLSSTADIGQLRNNCINLVVTLIRAFKNGWKKFVLLEK